MLISQVKQLAPKKETSLHKLQFPPSLKVPGVGQFLSVQPYNSEQVVQVSNGLETSLKSEHDPQDLLPVTGSVFEYFPVRQSTASQTGP